MNEIEYIIVQAGGKGSRLETLTTNKPKALVPVDNLPMIFHLFRRYPEAKFKIIADYQRDAFARYLKAFATVDYELVVANEKGTCSGISECLTGIPDETPFLLIWCDLVLSEVSIPFDKDINYIGISTDFRCRWSYIDGNFIEKPSSENGVSGLFVFRDKQQIADIPSNGEFVRWLARKNLSFSRIELRGGREIGTILSYFQNEMNKPKCRPFNRVEFKGDIVLKYPINEQGRKLADDEVAWYKRVAALGYGNIPKIYGYDPLVLSRVWGQNVFEYAFLTRGFKQAILEEIVSALKSLHSLEEPVPANDADCEECYITKTFARLSKVKNLVPFANDEKVLINGKLCSNVFSIQEKVIADTRSFFPRNFYLIHGDNTFHNMMIETKDGKVRPILFDPRGYFGHSKYYGDVDYDWAKLYYSVVGDYDQFNRKNFSLEIREHDIELAVVSNGWRELETDFFKLTGANPRKIKLLHALIWLSLTTYAWEDYDSICGAFYKGLLELQEYLDEK